MTSASTELSFGAWVKSVLERTEAALEHSLPGPDQTPQRLHQAMRYAVLGGGKRVRPLLCHAAGLAVGAAPAALDAAAAALEMIHVYSLVHDDLPSMDDDALRRGKPTVHIQYDEATALLVGDALQSQAFVTLAGAPLGERERLALVAELAAASGSLGMAGGQAIDLQAVGQALGRAALEQMHRMKTGALLRAAVRLGTFCGEPAQASQWRATLDVYAEAVGLAFQVVDDILDVTADSSTLGKTAGKDAMHAKPTFVSLLGLEGARALAKRLREQAHSALLPLGVGGCRLQEIADFVVERAY